MLLLGIALTLNFGLVSAADSSSSTSPNLQTSQTTTTVKVATTSTKVATKAVSSTVSTTPTKTIRVLIYNGNGAITSCVTGIKTALNSANTNNLVPGYRFTYGTSGTITSSILSNYDLFAMPGGSSGYTYIHSSSISSSAIKSFVSSGHGFLGICAGAYAGSKYVSGSGVSYNGWGIAPHVSSKVYNQEGNLQVSMTSSASQLLSSSGTLTLAHYNGPAMYGSGYITFASYAGGAYNSFAAIIGDTYGNGRAVLSGPHPELAPQNPTLLSKLIVWAANIKTSSSTTTITISQINSAAKTVKTYYETNKKLPSYITISGKQVTMSSFLYLLTSSLINVNGGSSAAVTLKTVSAPTAPSGTFKHGNIFKTEYIKLANSIRTFINTNGKAPNYVTASLGKIRYESAVYMYSKIMAFYYTNGRLPSYVSM